MAVDAATLRASLEQAGVPEAVSDLIRYRDALAGVGQSAKPASDAVDAVGRSSQQSAQGHQAAKSAADQHADSSKGLAAAQGVLSGALSQTGVNVGQLTQSFGQAKTGITDLLNAETGLSNGTMLMGAAFAGVAAAGIASAVTGLTSLYGRIDDVKDATGLTTDTVQGFTKIISEFGGSSEDASRPLTLLAREVGNITAQVANGQEPSGKFADALGKLHLNASTFADSSVSLDQKLRMLMDGVAGLGDKSQQTAILMDIFGRNGAKLADVMTTGSGALDAATRRVHELGGALSDSAEPATLAYFKAQSDMNTAIDGIKIAVGTAALPALSSFITTVAEATAGVHKFIDEASGANQPKQESWWEHFKNNVLPDIEFNGKPLDLTKLFGGPDTQKSLDQVQQSLGHVVAAVGAETESVTGLDDAIDKDRASQNLWRAGLDAAGESAADLKEHIDTMAASIGLGSGAAQASESALKVLSGQMTAVGESAGASREFYDRFGKAIDFANQPVDEQNRRLGILSETIKGSLDPGQRAAAESQKALDEAVRAMGPDLAEQQLHANELANAWTEVTKNGGDVPGMLGELQREFGATDEKVQTLEEHVLNLFSKPSSEELAVKAQLSDVTAEMSRLQAALANSSPAVQHVAAMQKVLDNARETGATVKEQTTAKANLDRALAETGPAGAAAAADQARIDKLTLAKGGLDAQLSSLQASRQQMEAHTLANQNNAVSLQTDQQAYQDLMDAIVRKSEEAAGKIGGISVQIGGIGTAIRGAMAVAGQAIPGAAGGGALGPGVGSFPAAAGGALSPQQIAQGLLAAGIPSSAVATMTAILLAETGGTGSLTADSSSPGFVGAHGFGQLMPGFEGISEAARMGTDPASLRAQFEAIARGYAGRGFTPWDPWSYVGGGNPNVDHGEINVGPGKGSFNAYLTQGQAAAAAAMAAGGQFPTGPGGLAGALGGVGAALGAAGSGALPSPAPDTSAAAKPLTAVDIQNETTAAERGLHDLETLAGTVNSATKASLASVTQDTVDSQQQVVASAKQTALARIQTAQDAENTLLADLASGAGPEQIKQDKANVTSAQDAAREATQAWKEADGTLSADQKAVVDNYTVGQQTILASARNTYDTQVALYRAATQEQHLQDLGQQQAHQQVTAQTVSDDKAGLATIQAQGVTAFQNVTEAHRQYAAAVQKQQDDIANHASAQTLAEDAATVNSLQQLAGQWDTYFGGIVQSGDTAYSRLTADQQAYAQQVQQSNAATVKELESAQDTQFRIQDAQARYNQQAVDPSLTQQQRNQASANAGLIGPLLQNQQQFTESIAMLTKMLEDPNVVGQQRANILQSLSDARAALHDVNNRISHLDDTTKQLPPELKGQLATDFNRIVGALGLSAALQAQANGTLEEVAGKLPGGGAGGAGGPGSVAVAGVMTASQAEEINNQLMAKYMADQWARAFNVVMAAQAQSENAAFGAMLSAARQAMLANLKAGLPANQGVYLPGEGPDPNADYGPLGYNAWQGRVAPGRGLGGGGGTLTGKDLTDIASAIKPPPAQVLATINATFMVGDQAVATAILPSVNLAMGQNVMVQMLGARR